MEQVPAGSGCAVGGRQREEGLEPLSKSHTAALPPPSVALQPRQSHFCKHTAKNPSTSSISEPSTWPCGLFSLETTAGYRKAAGITSGECPRGQVLLKQGLPKRLDVSQPCWKQPRGRVFLEEVAHCQKEMPPNYRGACRIIKIRESQDQ